MGDAPLAPLRPTPKLHTKVLARGNRRFQVLHFEGTGRVKRSRGRWSAPPGAPKQQLEQKPFYEPDINAGSLWVATYRKASDRLRMLLLLHCGPLLVDASKKTKDNAAYTYGGVGGTGAHGLRIFTSLQACVQHSHVRVGVHRASVLVLGKQLVDGPLGGVRPATFS